jgi:hypothetical protein
MAGSSVQAQMLASARLWLAEAVHVERARALCAFVLYRTGLARVHDCTRIPQEGGERGRVRS